MALIRPEFVRAAVKIRNDSGSVIGTGFAYARPDDYNESDPSVHTLDEPWRLWYVTCAHVIDAIETDQSETPRRVYIEVNEESSGEGRTSIGYPIEYFWTRHREWTARCSRLGPISDRSYTLDDAAVDVAVTTAPTHYKDFGKLDWWGFAPRFHMTKALMSGDNPLDATLSEGDEVFIVGFPVGFYTDVKNWPVVRQGVLAQMQPYLRGVARTFLIDGSVFGGNSGGPVITKPQPMSIEGTKQFTRNALVGMVSGSRLNPGNGENADLGIVVPLDTINETIEMALSDSPHVSRLTGSD